MLSEGPGTTIGSYKLLRSIGEGGFGTVFMAEQREPVQRNIPDHLRGAIVSKCNVLEDDAKYEYRCVEYEYR